MKNFDRFREDSGVIFGNISTVINPIINQPAANLLGDGGSEADQQKQAASHTSGVELMLESASPKATWGL